MTSSGENFKSYNLLPISKEIRYSEGGLRVEKVNKKKIDNLPFISIITVVKNGEKYLDETINSVLNQTYKNYEYIIVDGGSKDSTINIIKEYSSKIDYWVSETDQGLYDAFNKGMMLAKGDFIGIINSDDIYLPNSLEILKNYIIKNPEIDFIFGSVKKHWGVLHGYKPKKIFYSWGFYSSHSTGFFIKKSSAKLVGLYNLKYKFHADYDYFFRMIVKKKLRGMATKKDEIFGVFRRGGFSSTISFWKLFKEELKIRLDNGQNIFLVLFIFIFRFLKYYKRIIFTK